LLLHVLVTVVTAVLLHVYIVGYQLLLPHWFYWCKTCLG